MEEQNKKQATKGPACSISTLIVLCFFCLIISAITIPGYRMARIRANQRACYANQKTIAIGLEIYKEDMGKEPVSLDKNLRETLIKKGYI